MNCRLFRTAARIVALVATLFAFSCASRMYPPPGIAAETLLPPDAIAYAKFDAAFIKDALPFFLPEGKDGKALQKSAQSFLDKTSTLYLSLGKPVSRNEKNQLFAMARGTYPPSGVSLALALNKSWVKRGKEWVYKPGSLFLTGIDGNTLLLGTAPLNKFSAVVNAAMYPSVKTAAVSTQSQNPIPAAWREAWDSPFALYISEPVRNLGASMPIDDVNLPLLSMIVSGSGPRERGYALYMSFEFDSAPAALMFSPLCRLVLYGAAHRLWPEKAATVLDDALWRIDSRFVSVSGFYLEPSDIAALIGLLR